MRNLTGPRLAAMVGLVLGFAPIANWLTAGRELPWWSAAVMEWLVLGGAIVLLAVAVARLGGATVERAAAWCRRTALAPRPAVFGAFLALVAFTLALWFAFYCYGGRFFALRAVTDELIEQVRGLNRASVRAATHELDGPRAVREIARLQERMHFLVDGMRDVAGKEGRS